MPVISLEYHDVVPNDRWDDSGFPGPAAASYKLSTHRFLEQPADGRRARTAVVERQQDGISIFTQRLMDAETD